MVEFESQTAILAEKRESRIPGFPVESEITVDIGGLMTTIKCASFSDQLFITISQKNKFGTIIRASSYTKADGGKIFEANVLLGKRDDPLLIIYARQILEKLSPFTNKPLVLAICLLEEGRSKACFEGIINQLLEIAVWD